MPVRFFYIFAISLFWHLHSFGEVLMVTTTGDSGAGSLRQALMQAAANGTADKDYIFFNLPGTIESDVTITIYSDLPQLSGNLVIDGTSQPGPAFGISDARIIITSGVPTGEIHVFRGSGLKEVEIYGLWIKDFQGNGGISSQAGTAVFLQDANNIIIGAQNKGNVFSGNFGEVTFGTTGNSIYNENVNIGFNIIGGMPNGIAANPLNDQNRTALSVNNFSNLLVHNNLGYGYQHAITGFSSAQGLNNIIRENIIGLNINGDTHVRDGAGIILSNSYPYTQDSHILLEKNVIGGSRIAMWLVNTHTRFTLLGNSIGLNQFGNAAGNFRGLHFTGYTGHSIVGGDSPDDVNIIAHNGDYGIRAEGTGKITITKNSFYCNVRGGIKYMETAPSFVTIKDVIQNAGGSVFLSGRAPANAKVELFQDDECDNCEGKIYISSVVAGNDGKWNFTGAVTGTIVATATTVDGHTSEFSMSSVNLSKVVIKQACINISNGSITGLEVTSGNYFYWEDRDGNQVGSDTDLLNVPAGSYRFVVTTGFPGSTCLVATPYYQIAEDEPPIKAVRTIRLCAQGIFKLNVNQGPGLYRLYENVDSPAPFADSQTGEFTLDINQNELLYYVSLQSGECESVKMPVQISVSSDFRLSIPSAFTPNNDGVNDVWLISNLEDFPEAQVKVFNRYGTIVFQSSGSYEPFNGTMKGAPLPVGAYYYEINLKAGCENYSGSVTLIH